MKNLKKVIALIAVLALTLSTVALGATYTDVAEDSAYSVAVETLSKLDIVTGYEDGTYGPEKAVTRAEMAALIARIQGYDETSKAQTATVFADVPAEHWASGYVAAASNMGIVNGYGDGTFGPEDSVRYEQAVTMIMRTLGYEPFATANGGYPTGYLAAAQRYGLTKKVSNAVSGTDANRGTVAQLLYNGIDTPIMGQSKWSTTGEVEYTIYDGSVTQQGYVIPYKSLMSENLDVVKVKGVVTDNVITSLYNGVNAIDTEKDVEVGLAITDFYGSMSVDEFATNAKALGGIFLEGESGIGEALGYSVIAYAIEDEAKEEFEIIAWAKDSTTNSSVEFTLDQYDSLNNNGNIEYYKNATDNKTSELKFDTNGAVVVYNYVGGNGVGSIFDAAGYVTAPTTKSGKVTLIDNNTTNGYDVAIVEVGASRVIKKASNELVTFKRGTAIEIDPDETAKIINLTKDGKAILPSELNEWDVVTVVADNLADLESATYINAEVIGSSVVGKITATKKSDTSAALDANNVQIAYKIEGAYYDVASVSYEADDLEIGEGGTFYVDKYGKIVAFNEDPTLVGGTTSKYAYVLEAGEKLSFNKYRGQVRMLTANGIDIYDLDDEVDVDGTPDESFEDAAQGVVAAKVAAYNGQLIKYDVNAAGEITEIYTASSYASDVDNVEFKYADSTGVQTADWDADNYSLAGIVDEDAVVFLIPEAAYGDKNVDSKVGTIADLKDGEQYEFVKFIDKKGDDANVVVVTKGYGKVGKSSNVAVLTEVSISTDEAGDNIFVLSYYQDGSLKEGVETSTTVYNDHKNNGLSVGDIVKVDLTGDVITGFAHEINFSEDIRDNTTGRLEAPAVAKAETTVGKETTAFGYVKTINSASSVVIEGNTSVKVSRASNIYVVDASGRSITVKMGDESNITDSADQDKCITGYEKSLGDYVYYRKYDGGLVDVVIIKNVIDFKASEITNYPAN